jgi:hypothetical protein
MAPQLVCVLGALLLAASAARAQEFAVPANPLLPAGTVISASDLTASLMGVPEQPKPLPANAYRGTYVSRGAAGPGGRAARARAQSARLARCGTR